MEEQVSVEVGEGLEDLRAERDHLPRQERVAPLQESANQINPLNRSMCPDRPPRKEDRKEGETQDGGEVVGNKDHRSLSPA